MIRAGAWLAVGMVLLWPAGWLSADAPDDWRRQVEQDWLGQLAIRRDLGGASKAAIRTTPESDAAGAVDGVRNTRWGFHTGNDANPFWQVDLGQARPLDRAVIFNSVHMPERSARLTVLLSADAVQWREVYAHDGTTFGGGAENKPLAVPLNGASARFLRVQLPAPGHLHLNEVQVYGQDAPDSNIALGRPATQSSISQWSVAKAAPASAPAKVTAETEQYLKERWAARESALADPLLNFDRLLFVKRHTYSSSHIYTDHFDGSRRMGGNLCILSPVAPDGQVVELVAELNGGLFGRFDLSFDATRVVFAYKKAGKGYHGYRIYEIGIDGRGLRQLTFDPPDEAEMIRQFGHGYDDLDPCYLPNGRIMFASTRTRRTVLCHNAFTSTALHLMDGDGGNLHCVSANTVNEFAPMVMADGRVLYTRWEYVDKGSGNVQSLWSMHPDGGHSAHVYKNNVDPPATLIDARDIPGSREGSRLVAVGAPHMPLAVGPVVLIDIGITQLTAAAMTNLTPEIGYPGHSGYPSPKAGYYKEPWPLSEKLFLVACNPGPNHAEPAGYGIYLLDSAGRRELLYRDPNISCFQPTPLRPRPTPPRLTTAVAATAPDRLQEGTLFMLDIYQGLTGIERGRVKFLRVMEDVPKPWAPSWCAPAQGDTLGLQNPAVSLGGHFAIKRVHGVVPVAEDGSAMFTAPAGVNLYFQALDERYMELQRMRTFVNLMPGEVRSCIGCHEPRPTAPSVRQAQALRRPVRPPAAQPGDGGPRMVHYPRDVQPILDVHCVSCHGALQPKGGLDLTGQETTLFSRSYENLIRKGLVNKIDVDPRSAYIPAEPPLTFGSHRSKLIGRMRQPPCSAALSEEEFIRLVTWIDANAPFYGVYEGRKNLKWKGLPDFRPDPAPPGR